MPAIPDIVDSLTGERGWGEASGVVVARVGTGPFEIVDYCGFRELLKSTWVNSSR